MLTVYEKLNEKTTSVTETGQTTWKQQLRKSILFNSHN